MDKIRKLHCEERLKKSFDDLSIEQVKEFAGFYYPEKEKGKLKWEVVMLWEGEGYTANSQMEAEIISNQQEIIGLLLNAQKSTTPKKAGHNYRKTKGSQSITKR